MKKIQKTVRLTRDVDRVVFAEVLRTFIPEDYISVPTDKIQTIFRKIYKVRNPNLTYQELFLAVKNRIKCVQLDGEGNAKKGNVIFYLNEWYKHIFGIQIIQDCPENNPDLQTMDVGVVKTTGNLDKTKTSTDTMASSHSSSASFKSEETITIDIDENNSDSSNSEDSNFNSKYECGVQDGVFSVAASAGFKKSHRKFLLINYWNNDVTKCFARALRIMIEANGGKSLTDHDQAGLNLYLFVVSLGPLNEEVRYFRNLYNVTIYKPSLVTSSILRGKFEPEDRSLILLDTFDDIQFIVDSSKYPDMYGPEFSLKMKVVNKHVVTIPMLKQDVGVQCNPSDEEQYYHLPNDVFKFLLGHKKQYLQPEGNQSVLLATKTPNSGGQSTKHLTAAVDAAVQTEEENKKTITQVAGITKDLFDHPIQITPAGQIAESIMYTSPDVHRKMWTLLQLSRCYEESQPADTNALWDLAERDNNKSHMIPIYVKQTQKSPGVFRRSILAFVKKRLLEWKLAKDEGCRYNPDLWPAYVSKQFLLFIGVEDSKELNEYFSK